ncbi:MULTISPECIES: NAD-dependent epimerase/dehydratase family protein [Neobacillus]|uniref:NAD(P)-dependent oxidoreductase n=1 Tax=Neobacillus rhizophilus TaxID=2833579 RepID=A0A942U6Y6_9BACI|nr:MULTISPECIES: NAD(P)-dependent oxidoreductase [Neobacillus]MBS4212614.1 NAD(P)-dependent oxidoreductase [Neobacillus rhizophilus]MBU8915022.1 NAD(P)-dependent oxidoreductase [Bacillus sp. FJAT-29953]
MRQKTVLISGADGYIALHLARVLRNLKFKVLTATRTMNGDLKMDFTSPYEVASLKSTGIDAMIHTVSPNEAIYKTDPYRALSENATGVHAALDFCTNNHVKDFIYFSSFHVFGSQEGRLTENTPITPRNDYGLAHGTAELTVQMFDSSNKVNGWIVRPSNLFGVPVSCETFKRWNLIPFLFCREAVENQTITLLTPGNQLRNFVGVSDVCKKVLWILEQRPEGRIFHAYGKETMSVWQYALLVQKVALEIFNLPVRIIRPEGSDHQGTFEFTSMYDDRNLAPRDELETFVKEMINVLLTRSGKE